MNFYLIFHSFNFFKVLIPFHCQNISAEDTIPSSNNLEDRISQPEIFIFYNLASLDHV